jgi:copper chaperone CopZ
MEEDMSTHTYRVNGMTCGGCAKHVEKALRKVDGVIVASVDVAKGTASVEGAAAYEALSASVAEAGYELVKPA